MIDRERILPGPSSSRENGHPLEIPSTRIFQEAVYHKGREMRYTRYTEGPAAGKHLEDVMYLGSGRGRKEGVKRTRYSGRFRHAARGAEKSGRGWRVAGVGDVQVDGVTIRERKWGAGVTDKF